MGIKKLFEIRGKRAQVEERKLDFEIKQYERAGQVLESLPDFARDTDEDQWSALTGGKEVYTELEVKDMQAQAHLMYYSNPMAYGIIETLVNFVVGQSLKITAKDGNPDVQAYFDKFWRVNKMDNKSKELARRTFRAGEFFGRFFKPKRGSSEDKPVPALRFIEPNEIEDEKGKWTHGIEVDPNDIEKPVAYYRKYKKFTVEVGDKNAQDATQSIKASAVIHTKIKVDSNVKRGVSFFVGIAPYLTKYVNWLEDRIVLNRLRSFFAVFGEPTGPSAPSTVTDQFADVTGKTPTGGTPRKKVLKRGSMVASKGIKWNLQNLNIRASDTKEDGRAILHMIVTGTNLADYMVTGDPSNNNYASAMVAEAPAVKAFEAWQDIFEDTFKAIFRWVIDFGVKAGYLPEGTMVQAMKFNQETGEDEPDGKPKMVETSRDCQVIFPVLIHRDIKEETEALVLQITERLVSRRKASQTLDHDFEEEQKQIEKEETLAKLSAQDDADAHNIKNEPTDEEDEE